MAAGYGPGAKAVRRVVPLAAGFSSWRLGDGAGGVPGSRGAVRAGSLGQPPPPLAKTAGSGGGAREGDCPVVAGVGIKPNCRIPTARFPT